jgi:tetratricopeptide (TPR) repeat protein
MNAIISKIKNHQYNSRQAYKEDTKMFLCDIKEKCKNNNDDRKDAIKVLLIKLYDDLAKSISNAQSTTGAINDDAIEGILAIADTCIEEQNAKRKNSKLDIQLETNLYEILKNQDNGNLSAEDNTKARVNAFYSLCTKHRRIKEYEAFKKLTHDQYDKVNQDEIFRIMQAYYFIQETSEDFDPRKALNYWKDKISPDYKRLPAFTQIYTETVALHCETTRDEKSEENIKMLDESIQLIDAAIREREYAKFYSTRGRIYSCKGEYDTGIIDVRAAIEKEDSYREDYESRLNEYQALISRFQRKKDEKELREEATKIRAEMDKNKTEYISILGFFSAVMALIIGSIDIIKRQEEMMDSLQLLMGVAAMIIISFGSLNMLLARKEEKNTNKYPDWILLVIGGGLFVLSFLVRLLDKIL